MKADMSIIRADLSTIMADLSTITADTAITKADITPTETKVASSEVDNMNTVKADVLKTDATTAKEDMATINAKVANLEGDTKTVKAGLADQGAKESEAEKLTSTDAKVTDVAVVWNADDADLVKSPLEGLEESLEKLRKGYVLMPMRVTNGISSSDAKIAYPMSADIDYSRFPKFKSDFHRITGARATELCQILQIPPSNDTTAAGQCRRLGNFLGLLEYQN